MDDNHMNNLSTKERVSGFECVLPQRNPVLQ